MSHVRYYRDSFTRTKLFFSGRFWCVCIELFVFIANINFLGVGGKRVKTGDFLPEQLANYFKT